MYLFPGDSADGLSPAARLASLGERGRPSPGDPPRPERIVAAAARVRRAACPRRAASCSCPARPMPSAPRPRVSAPRSPARRPDDPPARFASASGTVRTALCVEPRDGTLYVFMPPVAALEDYLELVAAVEATAAALSTPVLLEGYPPPSDPRLAHFMITPDPGVIEVNVQPSESWDELVDLTTTLYEEARQTAPHHRQVHARRPPHRHGGRQSLRARRADRRRQPVPAPAGSAAPASSATGTTTRRCPICSRGSSSAPPARPRASTRRATTASTSSRSPSASSPPRGAPTPPWLVDRLFRNLLIDVTGNTHRAEFCIDKMFAADTAAGRRGLLEMRAFEMPPHARMSLAAAAPAARARRRLLARAVRDEAGAVGHGAARPVHAPLFRLARLRGRARRSPPCGLCLRARVVRPAPRVPLPGLRRRDGARGAPDAAPGARALARPRRGHRGRRRGALRRFLRRAAGGAGHGRHRRPPRRHVQWPRAAPAPDGPRTASSSRACATAPGSRRPRCIPPSPSTRR